MMHSSSRKGSNYVADFETIVDPNETRVWLWGLVNVDDPDNLEWGTSISSFMARMRKLHGIVYFHNLKFDGSFLLDYLLKHGLILDGTSEWAPRKNHFSCLISGNGKFYTIKVNFNEGGYVEFRDSYKKLPMSVKEIAKAFHLPESKGELDYERYREDGYEPTAEELDYLRRDVSIIAKALATEFDAGMDRLTVGSDSLYEFKSLMGPRFERVFPKLSLPIDAEIRKAYRGGFTYADPRFSGKRNGPGLVLDVNSLYPAMMSDRLIPYGEPSYSPYHELPTRSRPLTIFSVCFTARLKSGHIPCIQIKGTSLFHASEYQVSINNPVTMMVTNVDWDLFNDHYDIEVLEYGGTYSFHATTGIFDEYIEKWMAIKATSTGGLREIAKLHLNSLYGKFATNPHITSKIPVLKNDKVSYIAAPEETRNPVYTPAGVFITAWARDYTVRSAQANYSTFAYADTDSLHLITEKIPESLKIHPTEMGAWKHEYNFTESFYIRAKAYLEHRHPDYAKDGKEWENHIAGYPTDLAANLRIDHLRPSMMLPGKLQPKTVAGGVVLMEVPFELKIDFR